MSPTNAYEQPLSVELCDGEIVLRSEEGPFAVSLTPDAAAKTAKQLATAAKAAAQPPQASQTTVARD